jgi:hypothetical protein
MALASRKGSRRSHRVGYHNWRLRITPLSTLRFLERQPLLTNIHFQPFRCKMCECVELDKRRGNPGLGRRRYYVRILTHCVCSLIPSLAVTPFPLLLCSWAVQRSILANLGRQGRPRGRISLCLLSSSPHGPLGQHLFREDAAVLEQAVRTVLSSITYLSLPWNHKLTNGDHCTGLPRPGMAWLRFSTLARR